MKFIKNLLKDSTVEKRYIKAGATFGDAVSYLYMGECIGFEDRLNRWARWEKEYARRGFKTVSLDRFTDLGGHGKSIDDVLGQKREESEEPIFHAQTYREQFLGKIRPLVNAKQLIEEGGIQIGWYRLPSTEQVNAFLLKQVNKTE